MFQCFLKEHNIPVVFINGVYARINTMDFMTIDYYKPYVFHEPEDFVLIAENQLTINDRGHMSVLGHNKYSDLLYQHIKNVNLI